jgi:hypothetical protein
MSDLPFDRLRTGLGQLWRLIEELRRGEQELTASFSRSQEAAVAETEEKRQRLIDTQEGELALLDANSRREEEELQSRHAAEEDAAQRSLAANRLRLEVTEREERERIEGELKDALWLASSVLDGGRTGVQEQLTEAHRKVEEGRERSARLRKEVVPVLARVDLEWVDIEPGKSADDPEGATVADLEALLNRAGSIRERMAGFRLLGWMSWPITILIGILVAELGSVPALFRQPRLLYVLIGVFVGFLTATIYRTTLHAMARRRLLSQGQKFALLLTEADALGPKLIAASEAWAKTQSAELHARHTSQTRRAQAAHQPRLGEVAQRFRVERETLEQQAEDDTAARLERMEKETARMARHHRKARSRCVARQEAERKEQADAHAAQFCRIEQTRTEQEQQVRRRWTAGAADLMTAFTELQATGAGLFGAPTATGVGVSSAELPFGTMTVDVKELADGVPPERLAPFPHYPLHLPAFVPFPRVGGLLLHASGTGKMSAIATLQVVMLRFLTALPPGKVRFTILDPVGLGDNFAAFMHLADHDESLVTSRIWTEPGHIEKQLADLTGHMENVIQKYLRRQFHSIEEYNVQAGEVAEPYRILVVANFPTNFSSQAAARLVSIAQSGSSCGVYALVSMDTRQALPHGFNVEDLQQHCLNLYWRDERFRWGDAELDRYPLEPDAPPAAEEIIETARRIGALSRDANRVQVPFSFIGPTEGEIWKSDSRRGINVPLGRAGAVRRQALQLGQGTAQHLLVAGRTGSGKSTLWHALICNLALRYSPEEVELNLIDFKKGVEFKLYAEHRLPHARVIAIESEREFGLSVLQRLDAELRRRGDLFRAAGVHDVAGYRDRGGDAARWFPRILLIVDEFQEFFIEDDRLAQEAALLLDRLVRQGRAFGLHVLLGSQTLGGAYSLARSTIDQMAVRIALPCSETDAQLILSKDNSAARLLSRPGEAIYNDTNGSVESNEIFQVVWLPEEKRVEILETVRTRAERAMPEEVLRPALVFEGNTPADMSRNPHLLESPARRPDAAAGALAWLGDAIAIKEPTAAVFRPQTGNNLLLVGQDPDSALALLTSSLLSLAVQQPSARIQVLDGTGAHEPLGGYFRALVEGWSGNGDARIALIDRPGLPAALTALVEEMNRRLKGNEGGKEPRYLFINGLHRFREFRRGDDDLGFGRRGADRTVSPLENLQSLLRDGPGVGIHLLMWCDTLVNVMRSLDRAGLRECGQRVIFQMSPADSSHLLDSPVASRLGRNRALYHSDEMAQPEKFRPYGLPAPEWLAEIKQRLSAQNETPVPPAR